jgi:hypothetical protein
MKYAVNYSSMFEQLMPWFMRSYDFETEVGTFKLAESIEQEQHLILKATKGNFYFSPEVGVGIDNRLGGPINKYDIKAAIKSEMEADGMNVKNIVVLTKQDSANISNVEVLKALNEAKLLISIDAIR